MRQVTFWIFLLIFSMAGCKARTSNDSSLLDSGASLNEIPALWFDSTNEVVFDWLYKNQRTEMFLTEDGKGTAKNYYRDPVSNQDIITDFEIESWKVVAGKLTFKYKNRSAVTYQVLEDGNYLYGKDVAQDSKYRRRGTEYSLVNPENLAGKTFIGIYSNNYTYKYKFSDDGLNFDYTVDKPNDELGGDVNDFGHCQYVQGKLYFIYPNVFGRGSSSGREDNQGIDVNAIEVLADGKVLWSMGGGLGPVLWLAD